MQRLMREKIGKYRIVERIARGGMGTIFKAHDSVLDRLVALKVISTDAEITDELRARFFREAQACAQLSHPNIVTVYAMGDDDGQLFIVMELLEGEELKRLIAERRALALEDKLSIMIQVCDGLHYAHGKGIVHRDIKPGNIFLLRSGQVKILDFGIAHVANAKAGLTRTGLIMGSVRYISPEQVRGRVDHRSDIFSVGAVFYELLSLRPAFNGEDLLQLLAQLRTEEPPALDELDPAIPPALAAVVARAMRKEPAERFPDLAEMRARLEEIQRELTEEAHRLRARVADQHRHLLELRAALSDRTGSPGHDEPVPAFDEPARLATLQAVDRDLFARIEAVRASLRRADSLAPALESAIALLQSEQWDEAVEQFEAIVAEMPEHARAVDGLERARAQVEAEHRRLAAQLAHAAREAQEAARRAAQSAAAPRFASAPWNEAEVTAARAAAALARGAYAEARESFEAAIVLYGRCEVAAGKAQQQEREAAERVREEATREAQQGQALDETIRQSASVLESPTVLAGAPPDGIDPTEPLGAPVVRAERGIPIEASPALDGQPAVVASPPGDDVAPASRRGSRRVAVAALGVLAAIGLGALLLWLPRAPSTGSSAGPSVASGDRSSPTPGAGVAADIGRAPQAATAEPAVPRQALLPSTQMERAVDPPVIPPSPRPEDIPLTPRQALEEVLAGRNPAHAVTATVVKDGARIGRDNVRFSITSSRPGYVYVMAARGNGPDVELLVPGAGAAYNRIEPGRPLTLPDPHGPLAAPGRPRTGEFLAIVSDEPRDFSGLGSVSGKPFTTFRLGHRRLDHGPPGSTPLLAGTVACASISPCSASYGAVVFSMDTATREPGAPHAARRPPAATAPPTGARHATSPRCSDMLERASLGEPLTDEEQTSLTRDCR